MTSLSYFLYTFCELSISSVMRAAPLVASRYFLSVLSLLSFFSRYLWYSSSSIHPLLSKFSQAASSGKVNVVKVLLRCWSSSHLIYCISGCAVCVPSAIQTTAYAVNGQSPVASSITIWAIPLYPFAVTAGPLCFAAKTFWCTKTMF